MAVLMKLVPYYDKAKFIMDVASGNHVDWRYLRWVDYNFDEGRGKVWLTDEPSRAMVFADEKLAQEAWQQVSPLHPVRPDGQPNRPLTAYHVEFELI